MAIRAWVTPYRPTGTTAERDVVVHRSSTPRSSPATARALPCDASPGWARSMRARTPQQQPRQQPWRLGLPVAARHLIGLATPWLCAGCGRPDEAWCAECTAHLAGPAFAHQPRPAPDGLPLIRSTARYAGPARAAIVAWKDHGRRDVALPLAQALAISLVQAFEEIPSDRTIAVVPVPSSQASRRRRGEDVLLRVAHLAVRVLPRDLSARALVLGVLSHERIPRDQSGLNARERRGNMDHALRCVRAPAPGTPVILVDDVVTTGATLAESARALRDAGAEVAAAATIAATQRRRD